MNVACESCGATYNIDPEKMTSDTVKFECKSCSSFVVINRNGLPDASAIDASSEMASLPSDMDPEPFAGSAETKIKGLGLRFKLFFFFIILIVAFAIQAFYLILQLNKITDRFGKEGNDIIKEMAEEDILKTASSVARQVQLYLEAHPELEKEQFMSDNRFRGIAIQKVGKKGYTALNSKGEDGKWRTWAHQNPKICAPKLDDMAKLKGKLGKSFKGFWKVLTAVKSGRPAKGYYQWQESDGSMKDKYMVVVNVMGTPFNVAATTYIDEFTEPMVRLEKESKAINRSESIKNAILITVILVVIALILFAFGGRLTGNIKYLSEMTDRISLGDLDALIEVRSKDELGVLAESISRLQQSVKLSMKRLRK